MDWLQKASRPRHISKAYTHESGHPHQRARKAKANVVKWWRGGDLNSRPIDYESIALTN